MQRDRFISTVGAGAVGTLVSTGSRAQSQALEVVRVAAAPASDVTPLNYAVRTEMFKKAGLDVQWLPTRSGAAVMATLVGGGVEIGHANIVSLLQARERGVGISVIAPGAAFNAKNPFNVLMVRADSPYHVAADLNGKIVAVPSLSDLFTLAITSWSDKNGGDSKTIKFVEIPISAGGAALEQRRVDAAIMLYPEAGDALTLGKVRIIGDAFAALANIFMAAAWIATTSWAEQHVATVRNFSRIMLAAIHYSNANAAQVAPITSEITNVPLAVVLKTPGNESEESLDPAFMQPLIDAAAKYKFISKSYPASQLVFAGLR